MADWRKQARSSSDSAAVTTVAAAGYRVTPHRRRDRPVGRAEDVIVFHAGTSQSDDGRLRTAGGRVVAVTGIAPTFAEAQERSRYGAEQVMFPVACCGVISAGRSRSACGVT
jgi:phosphoribosylamine-glycine ligase